MIIPKLTRTIMLIIGIIFISLFLTDISLRIFSPLFTPILRTFIQEDALRLPNSASRVAKNIQIILRERDFQRPPDILVIGDSMVFGTLVKEKDLFTNMMSKEAGLTVLNLGIGGAAFCNYNNMLAYAINRLPKPPSFIVYVIFANDIIREECMRQETFAKYFIIEEKDYRHNLKLRIRRFREYIFQRSVLYQLLKRMFTFGHLHDDIYFKPVYFKQGNLEFLFAPTSFWARNLDPNMPGFDKAFQGSVDKINLAIALARRAGAGFFVVLMPFKEQVYTPLLVAKGLLPPDLYAPFYDSTYDRLRNILDSLGVTAIDLRPAFRQAAKKNERLYWIADGHLTPLGHRVAAEAILKELRPQIKNKIFKGEKR